eukprot:2363435-Rhodomonas_salina.1
MGLVESGSRTSRTASILSNHNISYRVAGLTASIVINSSQYQRNLPGSISIIRSVSTGHSIAHTQ